MVVLLQEGGREDARTSCLEPEGSENAGGEEMQLHTQQQQPTSRGWGVRRTEEVMKRVGDWERFKREILIRLALIEA